LKNSDLGQIQELHHWKGHMLKPIPRHQNQPPSYDSFEVMTKNVHFLPIFEKKRPFWKKRDLRQIWKVP